MISYGDVVVVKVQTDQTDSSSLCVRCRAKLTSDGKGVAEPLLQLRPCGHLIQEKASPEPDFEPLTDFPKRIKQSAANLVCLRACRMLRRQSYLGLRNHG